MIAVTYQSPTYAPAAVATRYVRYDGAGVYRWCEVDPNRWDIRQGTGNVDDFPPNVAMAAIARRNEGIAPFYVDWPL